jgi:hypothetical protein
MEGVAKSMKVRLSRFEARQPDESVYNVNAARIAVVAARRRLHSA